MPYTKMTPQRKREWRGSRRNALTKMIEGELLLGELNQNQIAKKHGVTRQWVGFIKKRICAS